MNKYGFFPFQLAKLQLQEIPDENIEELKTYTPEELEESNIQAIQTKLQTAEAELKAAKPNLNIINVSYETWFLLQRHSKCFFFAGIPQTAERFHRKNERIRGDIGEKSENEGHIRFRRNQTEAGVSYRVQYYTTEAQGNVSDDHVGRRRQLRDGRHIRPVY